MTDIPKIEKWTNLSIVPMIAILSAIIAKAAAFGHGSKHLEEFNQALRF